MNVQVALAMFRATKRPYCNAIYTSFLSDMSENMVNDVFLVATVGVVMKL